MIGGALARPCISYPGLFERGTIWDKYPYLLPNLFSAFVVLIGVVNGLLFLEETHAEKKMSRDRGLEIGQWILARLPKGRCTEPRGEKTKIAHSPDEEQPLLDHTNRDLPPGYRTRDNSPAGSPRLISQDSLDVKGVSQSPGISNIFTRQVVLNIMSFGILAL